MLKHEETIRELQRVWGNTTFSKKWREKTTPETETTHCNGWQGRVSSWNVYISGVFVVSLMSSLMRQEAFFPPVKMWEVFQNHNLTSGARARSWQCWETSAVFFCKTSCWTGSLRCQICLRPWSQNEFTEITEIYDDDDDMMEYV